MSATLKKHILILPRWYPNETDVQLGVFIQKQAALISTDFRVSLIYVQADSEAEEKFRFQESHEKGFHEIIVYFKSATGPLRKAQNYRRYRAAQYQALQKITERVDLCHVHVPYRSAGLALRLQRKAQVPFVITEHWSGHLTGEYHTKNPADLNLYKKVLAKATKISTVSQKLQQSFKHNTGFDSVVIPNVIESTQNTDESRDGKVRILSVSDFADKVKNVTGLLRSFRKALTELGDPEKMELVIVGGGPDEAKIKKVYTDLQFQEGQVIFLGRLENRAVLNEMQKADFYVCNSNFETFGMTVAEALMAGKPVITTRCGGPEEFIHEKNGILIDKSNEEQLATAIATLSESFQQYNKSAISKEIEGKFGAEAVLHQWKKFYEL